MTCTCSWCNTDMGTRPGPENQHTHSICEPCFEKQLTKAQADRLASMHERMQEVGMLLDRTPSSPLKRAVLNLADVVIDLIGEQVEITVR